MGKSMTGPDGIDIAAMMMAVGSLHSGRVEVTISPAGTGGAPCVKVTCVMTFDVLPGSSLPATVEVTSDWPCVAHRDLDAHIYHGLHKLDYAISDIYKQESYWQA